MSSVTIRKRRHMRRALHPTFGSIRRDLELVDGVNAKIAVAITKIVGSMWCAYAFALIALAGLGPALKPGGEGLVAWVAQTFLQLVLLSVIMVGQAVQSAQSDARAENTFEDTEKILDALDTTTKGGVADILDAINRLHSK